MKHALAFLAGCASMATAVAARAESDEPAPADGAETPGIVAPFAEAERLFDNGRRLQDQDDWVGACAMFDASRRLREVPAVLVKTARCRTREGRLLAANEDYTLALHLGPWAELEKLIRTERGDVRERLVTVQLVIDAPPERMSVARDGQLIDPKRWRERFWIAPGTVERVVADAPGYLPRTFEISGKAGESIEVAVAPDEPPRPPAPVIAQDQGVEALDVVAWSALAAGAVTLGFSAAFGVEFFAGRDGLYDDCSGRLDDGTRVCSAQTADDAQDVLAARTRAQVLLVVGAAVAAGGIVLLTLSTSSDGSPGSAVAADLGGLRFVSRW